MGAPMVMVMMVIVVTSGHRTKKNGAHHTFNGCKWRTMGVSCRQEDLPGKTRNTGWTSSFAIFGVHENLFSTLYKGN